MSIIKDYFVVLKFWGDELRFDDMTRMWSNGGWYKQKENNFKFVTTSTAQNNCYIRVSKLFTCLFITDPSI